MWFKDNYFKRVCNSSLVFTCFCMNLQLKTHINDILCLFFSRIIYSIFFLCFAKWKDESFDLKKMVLISKLIHSVYIIHYFISVPILYNILALKLKLLHYSVNQLLEMWMLKHLKLFFYVFVRNHYEWLL